MALQLCQDSIKKHKVHILKAGYVGLEARILYNYPPPPKALSIQSLLQSTTSSCSERLIQGIQQQEWTAEDIMRVVCLKALESHREYNCITEQFMEEAIYQAIEHDRHYRSTGQLVGPLHGIPIALKDDVDVKGYDSSLGCKCGCLQPKYMDAPIVSILRAAGAIPFCKTNVPWHLLSAECSNSIFGQTGNPLNKKLSPGGSSGGLASLITSGGAFIGIGSDDIGGLRIPAQHCNLYALRPTCGRFPSGTLNNMSLSWESIPSVLGPMSRHIQDLIHLFRSVSHTCTTSKETCLDPTVVPMPFNDALYQGTLNAKKLRVGYYVNDGFFRATPTATRAVTLAISRLAAQGHECIPVDPPSAITPMLLLSKLLTLDMSQQCTALRELQDDDISEPVIPVVMMMRAPRFLRSMIAMFFERVMEDRVAGQIVRSIGLGPIASPVPSDPMMQHPSHRYSHGGMDMPPIDRSYVSTMILLASYVFFWWYHIVAWMLKRSPTGSFPRDVQKLKAQKEEYQRLFAEIWQDDQGPLDVLVCPVHAIPPVPPPSFPYTCAGSSYSMVYSLLDYPAGVVPRVTQVSVEDKIPDTLAYVHSRDETLASCSLPPHLPPLPPHIPTHFQPIDIQMNRKSSFNFLGILGMEEFNSKMAEGVLKQGSFVGVQVVGKRFEEEKVLAVMTLLDQLL